MIDPAGVTSVTTSSENFRTSRAKPPLAENVASPLRGSAEAMAGQIRITRAKTTANHPARSALRRKVGERARTRPQYRVSSVRAIRVYVFQFEDPSRRGSRPRAVSSLELAV